MNWLKALPWTEILLVMLLIATVMNYVETRRVHSAIQSASVWQFERELDNVSAIQGRLDTANQHLNEIEWAERCREESYLPGCPIRLGIR